MRSAVSVAFKSRYRDASVALLALLALAAIGPTGASAALTPEITPAGTPTAPLSFTASTGEAEFHRSPNETIGECRTVGMSGSFSSATGGEFQTNYCEARQDMRGVGKISLGYTTAETSQSGLLFAGGGAEEVFLTPFVFTTLLKDTLFGGVIAKIEPLNKKTKQLFLTLELGTYGREQAIQSFACRRKTMAECVEHKDDISQHDLKDSAPFSIGLRQLITLQGFKQGGKLVEVEVKA